MWISSITSLYLLCCILRIVKIKDLANTIAAALFCPLEAFTPCSQVKLNGYVPSHNMPHENQQQDSDCVRKLDTAHLSVRVPRTSSSQIHVEDGTTQSSCSSSDVGLREALLSYIRNGNDVQALGSLSVLATLLQTKELDESMLDALGILPQRKQHKKLLLQALVGEGLDEEQLFSSGGGSMRDGVSSELDGYLQKLKEQYGVSCSSPDVEMSSRVHRHQVLDALVGLFCRSNISAETLWDGGWLLRQLLPYSEAEFNSDHLQLLKDSYQKCANALQQEIRGIWPDLLVTVLTDEWKKCKKVIESSSPRKEPKDIILPPENSSTRDIIAGESSFTAGEKMCELVKVFVLLHQLQIFSLGRALPEQPSIHFQDDVPVSPRATTASLDASGPMPGTELKLADAVPCRIAFERGKERHFSFLAISAGTSGWVVLAEELPLTEQYGIVRVTAPLAGCNPQIDDKHSRWLHLRIRPSTLPFLDPAKRGAYGKLKSKSLVDGRWTLAFRDEESCKNALSMILEEINLQRNEVERRLKPLLEVERILDNSNPSSSPLEASSSSGIMLSN
ncbi:uncharacterized protein LOC110809842 isoform X2 [Carica papaya]|nr:uncharacterized protein LOC110809842 isoform X2 [Carica papaya]